MGGIYVSNYIGAYVFVNYSKRIPFEIVLDTSDTNVSIYIRINIISLPNALIDVLHKRIRINGVVDIDEGLQETIVGFLGDSYIIFVLAD